MDRARPGSGSQTVTSFFTRKTTCLTTVPFASLGFMRLMDRKNRHVTVQNQTKNTRGAVGTSTRAVASTFKNYKNHSSLFQKKQKTHSFARVRVRHRHSQGAPRLRFPSSSLRNLMVSPFMPSTSSPRSPCRWTSDGAWGSASCIICTLSPQTPCRGGASFACDKPFLGRLTQETRACGFVWRVLAAVTRLTWYLSGPRAPDLYTFPTTSLIPRQATSRRQQEYCFSKKLSTRNSKVMKKRSGYLSDPTVAHAACNVFLCMIRLDHNNVSFPTRACLKHSNSLNVKVPRAPSHKCRYSPRKRYPGPFRCLPWRGLITHSGKTDNRKNIILHSGEKCSCVNNYLHPAQRL